MFLFLLQFICLSVPLLSKCLSVLFPLTTFQINLISFYSPINSSPDLVSLRQKAFYLNDRASDIDCSATNVAFPWDSCISLKPTAQWEENALPAKARSLISTNNGNRTSPYISHRLTRVQVHGPGVLLGPTEREESKMGPQSLKPIRCDSMSSLNLRPRSPSSLNTAIDGWQTRERININCFSKGWANKKKDISSCGVVHCWNHSSIINSTDEKINKCQLLNNQLIF